MRWEVMGEFRDLIYGRKLIFVGIKEFWLEVGFEWFRTFFNKKIEVENKILISIFDKLNEKGRTLLNVEFL